MGGKVRAVFGSYRKIKGNRWIDMACGKRAEMAEL